MDIARLYEMIQGHRITTDSRQIQAGDVFIALKGENFNGNAYAADAVRKGAFLSIIDDPGYGGEHCIPVENCLDCLQQLAHHHRKTLGIPVLAITGTNGKTTTKELCCSVLSEKYRVTATQGNLNNHIGVPLTLLSMDRNTEIGIVEMGANHPGEIAGLCRIAEPDYGIITNIGYAHLEGFGSYENIIETKSALYRSIAGKGGKLFVNASDPLLMELSASQARETYGRQGDLLSGEIRQTVPYLVYDILTPKGHLYIRTHLVGGYNFDNAMAASAAGLHFGVDPLRIQAAIEAYRPSNLRSQLIRTARNTIILDAYNANPSSMQAAISNFKEMQGGHKILILGEMLELGKESSKAHRELVGQCMESGFEHIFLIGNNFADWEDKCNFITCIQNTESLICHLQKTPLENAFILVKGSRGNRLERITEYL